VTGAYRLRPPAWEDLSAAAEVLAADDLDDAGQVVLDTGFLRAQWQRTGFDLSTDAWVAVSRAGTVVGYGQVTRDATDVAASWGVVHPAHRGQGIGSALFERIETRALALLAGVTGARFRHAVNAGDEAAAALLRARGLRLVRHFWHMSIDLPAEFDPAPPPQGIDIRRPRAPEDLRAVHAVLDGAFADHWDYHHEPFERWAEAYIRVPDYDPDLWRLAWEDKRLVGALTAVVLDDSGWVSLLGVRADARGRGIARALLRHAFAGFAARGVHSLLLVVDAENPTGATALYERVGMTVVKRFDLWERAADQTASPRR
jgi:mycothiol synthase